ncbi:1,25-dihydroxyvitamin D(3) 24-hydroxylase, mitochondrial-like [Symsagittifera roscoffensis]|uniref:1,25-dihydroxyvitamin D(3) 24-hydroxylase, mitochondrial-like n=1 Tax=Symsagittifera roscoffensis TaxID=84072 RepID=UPI00307B3EC5
MKTVKNTLNIGKKAGLDSIPGPRGLPVIGVLPHYAWNHGSYFSLEKRFSDTYGPIHTEKLLFRTSVVLSSPELIQQLTRSEGQCPMRPPIVNWEAHRENIGMPRGLVSSWGEEWRRCRRAFSGPLLKPTEVNQLRPAVKQSMNKLGSLLDSRAEEVHCDEVKKKLKSSDLLTLLKVWSLEVAFSVTFGKNHQQRIMSHPIEEDILEFIDVVDKIFVIGTKFFLINDTLGKNYLRLTRHFNKHFKYWDYIFNFCRPQIQQKLNEAKSKANPKTSDDETMSDGGFLEKVLSENSSISENEVISSVTELIYGAIDQTSLTLGAILGELAMNPTLQSQLRSKINTSSLSSSVDEDYPTNVFVRAVMKEGFRMFPSMTRTVRKLTEDMELGGYHLPEGTYIMIGTYAIGRNPEYFRNPDTFDPTRWLNDSGEEMARLSSPFLIGNFGFGARMCIGKRLAEMQIYEALIYL